MNTAYVTGSQWLFHANNRLFTIRLSGTRDGVAEVRDTAMSRSIVAVLLAGTLVGCVTSEGPYSRTAVTALERQPATPPVNREGKATQISQAPRHQKMQVALRQRATGPLAHRTEYPIILGAAF
jgi:hypothetical protein